jgi:hypothetical protein
MRNAGNYLFYGFGYLTLQQTYHCKSGESDDWGQCTQQAICENVTPNFEFAVDRTDPDHIENWVQEMGIQSPNTPRAVCKRFLVKMNLMLVRLIQFELLFKFNPSKPLGLPHSAWTI